MADAGEDSRKRERDDEDDQQNKRPAADDAPAADKDSKPIGVFQSGNTRQAAPTTEFSELDSVDTETKVTVILEVPDEFVGRIMGKSGQTLRTIQSLTNSTVEIPAESEAGSTQRKIRVTGRKYQIKYVNAIFQSKMKVGEDAPIPMPVDDQMDPANPLVRRIVPVPNDQVGRLIGKQGATIRQLQELSGCYMEVAKECEAGSSQREVTLIGNQTQATQCENYIKMKLSGEPIPAAPGSHPSEMHLLVPNDMVGRLIGKGGQTIRDIQDMSGAHMDIAKECAPGMDQREVTLKGLPDQVNYCQQLLQQKCQMPLTVTSSVTNPAFFASGGASRMRGPRPYMPMMQQRPPMGGFGGFGAGGYQPRNFQQAHHQQHQQQPPMHHQQQPMHHQQQQQQAMHQRVAPQQQAPDYSAYNQAAAYAAYGQAAAAPNAYGQVQAAAAAPAAAAATQDPAAAWAAYYAQYGYSYDPNAMAAYTAGAGARQ